MNSAILIIEDEYALAAALATVVRRMDATPVVAASGQGGIDKLGTQNFGLVILDVGLPDVSGLKVLEKIQALPKPPPVIIITAHGTLDTALEARRLGAREYFLKPLDLAAIQRTIREVFTPAKAASTSGTTMIGTSDAMQRAFAVIAQASGCDAPVLLQGPPGSGKTLAAQVIHRHSARSSEPLVVFRADEWAADRVEAALDEAMAKAGRGVLVLDEISTFSKPLQAALLHRIPGLQARLFSTAGGELSALREDLFYALTVLQVTLPPLAERTADLPALAASFLGDHVLSAEALAALKAYAWPGNVRELKTSMSHAAAVCGGRTILPHHLPSTLVKADDGNHLEETMKRSLAAWLDQKTTGPDESMPAYDDLLETVEASMLDTLLQRFDGKPTRLAAALKMNRATLRRKLKED
ncbi:MAG: sigma-54-dependent Fis family transcriptional regulator [Prosthecobacter sp.]|jgi:DNA-binding NtrC family response regulator|uniref:sigma-54-dependent transcriptional regulator n=1 Tax=Prosthecobacter sp. TaxID=1965333 RepID=UPI001A00F845|nr:response regulator [Prosthecobacter sp.]MBE2285770.1 sigma-54-dependent Fis family transcriptional regulator [Prosthecobacter sp.]